MQSSNPAFRRMEGFNGQSAGYPGVAQQPDYAGFGTGGGTGYATATDRMTIDSTVQKTGITLGVLVLTAAATWALTGSIVDDSGFGVDQDVLNQLYVLSLVGSLGGFVLSLVNSFKRVVSPALVLAYAALEGVFVGAFSKVVETYVGADENVVVYAVAGTIAAVAGTLAAYKFFDIQVGSKFRKWVVSMMFGFVAVSLLDMVLGFFHKDFGFNGMGTMGLISSFIGLAIGVLMLILDFDFVERGVAAGLPERESWRAAFGLTVTIVWIYIELLRIIAILRGDD